LLGNCLPLLAPRPGLRVKFQRYLLPLALFAASIVTTMAIGARFMQNFLSGLPTVAQDSDLWPWPWLIHQPEKFLLGWQFSAALLGILLAHEFGHYFACRAHGIETTLPLLLPAPTLSGTAGAVILIRGRIPNRCALIDVGASGPIFGYIASLIAIAVGFWLSKPAPIDSVSALIAFGQPMTIGLVHSIVGWFHPGAPAFALAVRHPVLVAGWVGLFITSLNLIPAGQLDGGHILYAVWPKLNRPVTLALSAILIACGVFFWIGWVLWGLIMLIPAMRHPKVPVDDALGPWRRALAAAALVLFALTFSLQPFMDSSILHYFR
jgi:hypothetical protein